MARNELRGWWATLPSRGDAALVQAELLDFFPYLLDAYGEVASTVAVDWYEEVLRESGRTTRWSPDLRASEVNVNYALQELGPDGDGSGALKRLESALGRLVKQHGRQTIMDSSEKNGRRFARVPNGPNPCAFCLTLASRGFVYSSRDTAGGFDPGHYHNDCFCEIVPEDGVVPSGYDPEALYRQYKSVHGRFDDITDVTSKLRSKYDLRS